MMLHVGTGDHWRKSANCGYLTLSAAVYQRQLSVPSLRGLLMSISESWGVNGHWPGIRSHAASAGVRLRAKETEISAAPWALRLGKGLYFTLLYLTFCAGISWTNEFPTSCCNCISIANFLGMRISVFNVKQCRLCPLLTRNSNKTITNYFTAD